MRRYPLLLALVPIAVLMTGCGKPPVHKYLDPALMDASIETECVSMIPADEISIHVVRAEGSGLIGGLMAKSANAKESKWAVERIQPLLDESSDVDFRRVFWGELESALREIPSLDIVEVKKTAMPASEKLDDTPGHSFREQLSPEGEQVSWFFVADSQSRAEASARRSVLIETFYELTPDARSLAVRSRLRMFLPGEKEPAYFGWVTWFSEPITDEIDEAAIAMWATDGAASYRATLQPAAAASVRMIRMDMSEKPAAKEREDMCRVKIVGPLRDDIKELYKTDRFDGWIVDRSEDCIVLRERRGNLFSFPVDQLEITSPDGTVETGGVFGK